MHSRTPKNTGTDESVPNLEPGFSKIEPRLVDRSVCPRIFRHLARACLFVFLASCLSAQAPEDLFHKAPPAVEEALRARITQFFQLHVDGKFRQAESLVAEDTKDFFYSANKPKYLGFEIKSISYNDDFTKAKAVVVAQMVVMVPGFLDKQL